MQYRRFVAESINPKPSYTRIDFDGLRFFRSFFPAGSWQSYCYPLSVVYAEAPTCHIQISGIIDDPAGVWPRHAAGWLSRRDRFVIPAGTHTRLAVTDAVRWCCLGPSGEGGAEHVDTIMLPDGATKEMLRGASLFPVSGSLLCGDVLCNSGSRVRCVSDRRCVTAVGQVLAFVWRCE